MSGGFAHYFFIWCTELTQPCLSSGSLSLHCGIIRRSHTLKTITSYKYYNFIYSNTTVTVTYMYLNLCTFPLHCGIIRRSHTLKTITSYKYYNFIYSNTTVTVTYMYLNYYLSEPCVRCSFSHISIFYLPAFRCEVLIQEKSQVESLNSGLSIYIHRKG